MTDRKPRLPAPDGVVDCHMHFYDNTMPAKPGMKLPNDATVEQYQALRARIGIARTVVVQANGYGADNRVTLAGMAALGDSARGIVVVEPDVSDAELARLHALGARGVRFHLLPGGHLGWDSLDRLSARIVELGWHSQLQLDGRTLPERIDAVLRVPGNFVIDHVGKFLEPVAPDHAAFKALLHLVDTGRCYVKLSAPYEVSRAGPPDYADVGALAAALVKAAPERMMWASNWPHPFYEGPAPDDAGLFDLLGTWAPDEATRRRILVDTPAALYGF